MSNVNAVTFTIVIVLFLLVTLVGQGLTLPPLIRFLGLSGNTEVAEEEVTARCAMLTMAIRSLQLRRASAAESELHDIDDILHRYQHRLEAISVSDRISHTDGRPDNTTQAAADRHLLRNQLVLETVAVERRTLLQLQEDGSVGDDVLRSLERDLDLTDSRYKSRN